MAKSTSIPLSAPRGSILAQQSRSDAALLRAVARRQSELIVEEYLQTVRYACSSEYRLGMIDALCHQTLGSSLLARFKPGTVQADAHRAGVEHGLGLFELIGSCEISSRIPAPKGAR